VKLVKNQGINLKSIKHIHMVGIGGIGMSALARILLDYGITVSGSDLKKNNLTEKLKEKGCHITKNHGSIYGKPQLLVRSFGVKDNNPEVIEARSRGIAVRERSELLRALIESKERPIAITGTHGKTTTTAMISYLLDRAKLSPTVLIGGEVDYFRGNAKSGGDDVLVAETDESDGFLSKIISRYAVITNIEKEHMEHYKKMQNLLEAFKDFIGNIPSDGVLFYNKEDQYLQKLSKHCRGRRVSFGISSKDCDIYAKSIEERGFGVRFMCYARGKKLGWVVLNVPGIHNVYNALAAIAVALEFGVSFAKVKSIIPKFRGVKRRFEVKSRTNKMIIVEDYAHHPTEIKSVINIASGLKRNRIIAVFQPHRFTRTMYLGKEFARAFKGVDELLLTNIYAANENPIKGVGVESIRDGAIRSGIKRAQIMPKGSIARYIGRNALKGDIVLVLGAGNINEIITDVVKNIKAVHK